MGKRHYGGFRASVVFHIWKFSLLGRYHHLWATVSPPIGLSVPLLDAELSVAWTFPLPLTYPLVPPRLSATGLGLGEVGFGEVAESGE